LAARWPWANVRVGEAESLEGTFDHVLLLRSWNHLRDPKRALERIVAVLRPGGTLTVVDNVAFGLVRSRAQAERAESGPAVHEHFRNDGPPSVTS